MLTCNLLYNHKISRTELCSHVILIIIRYLELSYAHMKSS